MTLKKAAEKSHNGQKKVTNLKLTYFIEEI